jgi:hypothetical protein
VDFCKTLWRWPWTPQCSSDWMRRICTTDLVSAASTRRKRLCCSTGAEKNCSPVALRCRSREELEGAGDKSGGSGISVMMIFFIIIRALSTTVLITAIYTRLNRATLPASKINALSSSSPSIKFTISFWFLHRNIPSRERS